jgi:hypothetical protein
MAKTSAERQQDFRRRVNAATITALGGLLEEALERCADLEADLERALARTAPARCPDCGTPLACPSCHGSDSA